MSPASFEDLASLSDQQIQIMLKKVHNVDLSVAMYQAPDKVQKAIFKNMSSRAGEVVRSQTREMGKINAAAVCSARHVILSAATRLSS